jgi:Cof subfamily protein (haloacid dehalogenase superfamily)
MIKLVAIDLDGTLLNSEKEISDVNYEMIKACQDKGIKIVIASGRIYPTIIPYIKTLGLEKEMHVGHGGGTIFNQNGIIASLGIYQRNTFEYLVDEIRKRKLDYFCLSGENVYYENGDDKVEAFYCQDIYKPILNKVNDIKVAEQVFKFVFIHNNSDQIESIKNVYHESSHSYYAAKHIVELSKKSLNKFSAITQIAEAYSISPDEILSIGDNENDIEMLSKSGIGIAMKNASPLTKRAANFVSKETNNEDGVAQILENYVLNN